MVEILLLYYFVTKIEQCDAIEKYNENITEIKNWSSSAGANITIRDSFASIVSAIVNRNISEFLSLLVISEPELLPISSFKCSSYLPGFLFKCLGYRKIIVIIIVIA